MSGQIYFKCPSCRKSCVVEAGAAGYLAPCPHCQANVRIPARSSLPPQYLRAGRTIALNILIVLFLTTAGVYVFSPAQRVTGLAGPAPILSVDKKADEPPRVIMIDASEKLTAENQKLLAENQGIRMQFEELGNWVLRNFKGKYPLPDRLVPHLTLVPVNDDFTLQADVADLLQVNPQEKSLVDDALVATQQSIVDLENSMMTVTQSAAGKVMLYVPSYADKGSEVREDLYAALETTLGQGRFNRFRDVTDEKLEKTYHYFGNASRTMIFEVTYPQDTRLPAYLVIKDGWIIPQGESSRSMEVTETAVNELPKPYLAYLDFLPDDVAAYAR